MAHTVTDILPPPCFVAAAPPAPWASLHHHHPPTAAPFTGSTGGVLWDAMGGVCESLSCYSTQAILVCRPTAAAPLALPPAAAPRAASPLHHQPTAAPQFAPPLGACCGEGVRVWRSQADKGTPPVAGTPLQGAPPAPAAPPHQPPAAPQLTLSASMTGGCCGTRREAYAETSG
jgi:hypothetical protein